MKQLKNQYEPGRVKRNALTADYIPGKTFTTPADGQVIDRLIYLNNITEWAPVAQVPAPHGLHLDSAVTTTAKFKQLIIRDNVMRRQAAATANGQEKGVYLDDNVRWDNIVIDNNLIEVGGTAANGISHPSLPTGATVSLFNNREANNNFLAGRNRATTTQDQELTTDVEALY